MSSANGSTHLIEMALIAHRKERGNEMLISQTSLSITSTATEGEVISWGKMRNRIL
jgi:hypothetical protein